MDYKEKYEQALERAKYYHDRDNIQFLENIFPELCESDDERIRKELISFVRGMLSCHDKPNAERDEKYESWIAWLEKECEKDKFIEKELECIKGYREDAIKRLEELEKQGEQKPAEWSEDDERLFQIVIDILDRENHLGNISHTDLIACVKKLKSLRPQSQWKPSDEQLYTLEKATHIVGSKYKSCLNSLYSELKKLREE